MQTNNWLVIYFNFHKTIGDWSKLINYYNEHAWEIHVKGSITMAACEDNSTSPSTLQPGVQRRKQQRSWEWNSGYDDGAVWDWGEEQTLYGPSQEAALLSAPDPWPHTGHQMAQYWPTKGEAVNMYSYHHNSYLGKYHENILVMTIMRDLFRHNKAYQIIIHNCYFLEIHDFNVGYIRH